MKSVNSKKSICLLGASGSIGASTLEVVRQHPGKFKIFSIAAQSNWESLLSIIKEFEVEQACLWEPGAACALKRHTTAKVYTGMDGLLELVSSNQIDYVVNGLVGAVGCEPTLQAIKSSKHVGLANKETMVMAGVIINEELKRHKNSRIIPIDSEHSAIFQCMADCPPEEVEKILLTGSGGPFRTWNLDRFNTITRKDALNHPTWSMGEKITIDSATMMNKGLEVIEAHHLFRIEFDKIEIVIHPASIIHSFVQFRDGSLMAQMGMPSMQLPILYALTCPQRLKLNIERVNIPELGKLEFTRPDFEKFPCLKLAYEAGIKGGTAPAVINAANEIAVALFLKEIISFNDIANSIRETLSAADIIKNPDLDQIIAADSWARSYTKSLFNKDNLSNA